MARDHFIACVHHMQWRVARWRGAEVTAYCDFDLSAGDAHALTAWLQQSPQASLTLLCDCAEEHYQVETLPAVRAGALRQLIARRQAAWPPAAGQAAIHWVDSLQSSRREERYLLSALAADCPLLPWLHTLVQQGVRLRALHLQSMLAPCWLQALMPGAMQVLCVVVHGVQGRLSYLQQGTLLFSRQMHLISSSGTPDSAFVDEISQTRMYLLSQRWLQESDVLQVLYISEAPSLPEGALEHRSGMTLHCYSAPQLIQALPLSPPPVAMPLLTYCAMAMVKQVRGLPNLASVDLQSNDRVRRARHALYAAATALCLLGVIVAWFGAQGAQQLTQQVNAMRVSHQRLQAAMPVAPLSSAERQQIQRLLGVEQTLRAAQRLPDRLLAVIPSMMDPDGCWQIHRLRWWYGPLQRGWPIMTSVSASGWQEVAQVELRLRDGTSTMLAERHWQQLLAGLKHQPEIAEVHVALEATRADSSLSAGEVLQGHTQQSASPFADRPQLWLRFRPVISRPER